MEKRNDFLDPDKIIRQLSQSIFSRNIVFHKSLESTNTLAKELADDGAPEGTIVLAEEQRAGRGRLGRQWLSPGYVNILVSILLRPTLEQDQLFILTMILALAAIESINGMVELEASIKWPNDLYVGRRKLAGILTEFSHRDDRIEYVVLGIGINVNWDPDEHRELINPATSILKETGVRVSRNTLLVQILKKLESYYQRVVSGRIDEFYRMWNERSLIMGRNVVIESGKETLHGTATRITRRGALVIKDEQGREHEVYSGDVSLRF